MHRRELESLFDIQLQKIAQCVKDALNIFEADGYKSVVGNSNPNSAASRAWVIAKKRLLEICRFVRRSRELRLCLPEARRILPTAWVNEILR